MPATQAVAVASAPHGTRGRARPHREGRAASQAPPAASGAGSGDAGRSSIGRVGASGGPSMLRTSGAGTGGGGPALGSAVVTDASLHAIRRMHGLAASAGH